MQLPFEFFVMVTSMICNILTIAVYLFVKKLQNTLGKCIMSCLFSMVMAHFILVLHKLDVLVEGVSSNIFIFFVIAYVLWLSAISFHLWKSFKSVKKEEDWYQFLVYSALVWITAAVIIGIRYFMNKFELENAFGWLLLSIFNLIMFILTAIHIWKVKRDLKMCTRQEETTTTCLDFDNQTLAIFLRLFVMVDVSWLIFSIILIVTFFKDVNPFLNLIISVHYFFGIFNFILLVCKRSTIKLIEESIRERRPSLKTLY
ncbi:probable G-protein coupled receptor Mth-like 12 isoform X2 [Drosophila biarmipes]|uniref:probable G-protein coupled receptor Mth-like 12 isoform X2 n=1 Tax=Drosophila biarmipes TaxID=125945 RepID=UPI0021CCCBB1|nr:probable G-protein coupled receptor Mth-like 12 isoform X2 [Drosophila biarmipes]